MLVFLSKSKEVYVDPNWLSLLTVHCWSCTLPPSLPFLPLRCRWFRSMNNEMVKVDPEEMNERTNERTTQRGGQKKLDSLEDRGRTDGKGSREEGAISPARSRHRS